MMPGNSVAYVLGILFGFVGFCVSLNLSPVVVEADQKRRDYWSKMAGTNALSLLRAAECPPGQAGAELLRPARSGNMSASEQLLRAVQPEGSDA
jgi:hypothetical protein